MGGDGLYKAIMRQDSSFPLAGHHWNGVNRAIREMNVQWFQKLHGTALPKNNINEL